MSWPEIDLPKVAGVAGSVVGLIIGTTIMQSWVTSRYVPAFERYRALAGELRGSGGENRRRESLREQTDDYRRRLKAMSRASCLLCWVMVAAVLTIFLASAAIALPTPDESHGTSMSLQVISLLGAVALSVALLLDLAAVGLIIYENNIDRRTIDTEVKDIDEVNGGPSPGRP